MDTLFTSLPHRTRWLLLMALSTLAIGLSAWATRALGRHTLDVVIFCLPPALTFGLAMRWGLSFALAGAVGTTSFFLLSGHAWDEAMLYGAGAGVGPALGAYLHRRTSRPETEVLKRLRLIALGLFVMAPVTAFFLAMTGARAPFNDIAPGMQYAAVWGIEVLSAMLFTPLVLVWVPEPGVPTNDVSLARRASEVVMVVIALLLVASHVAGLQKMFVAGQVLLLASLGLALIPVFVGTTRASASIVAVVAIVAMIEQANFVRGGASLLQLTARERLAGMGTVLFFGSMVLHLLNGIAVRSAKQKRELETQIYKNPFSGLPNRGYFFKALHDSAEQHLRKNAFYAEIAIPDLNYWAEFSGQEAVHRADTLIAQGLDRALRPHAHYLAHASLGRYFVNLYITADPLMVIDLIEKSVSDACEHSGVRRMRVRPQVALLRVPADIAAGAEDIQTALAQALQRSDMSQKRWSMATLQQKALEKQRDEIRENEKLVDLLTRSEILVYAQLISPLREKSHDGLHYEVLARMRGHEGEAISPARFLPVYTAYGLLPQFDREVIQHLFALMAREPGLVQATKVCSINLTGPTISDAELLPFIEAQFASAVLKPSQVIFEITESNHISNRAQALDNVAQLRELGCAVALDDFGTGLASFDYLKTFRPDWIKIDGSFVRDAGASAINREVVSSMIRVAKAAGARVVAEQVEEQSHIDLMRTLGAHYVQGYGIARPEPLQAMAERCRLNPAPASAPERERSDAQELAGVHQPLGV